MHLYCNPSQDPAYNLALEEYMLAQKGIDIIMLWRNAGAVIIGRNQNAMEEIDVDFVKQNDITVIRRQSGGGAVFHDLGNINFTVIHALGEEDFGNYAKFTQPICAFLQTLGVSAKLEGRNDLLVDGMKFSGNAQAAKNRRIMHHGTILYDADFGNLEKALRPRKAKIESKGIKSVRSRVTNLARHLKEPMPVETFLNRLHRYFLEQGDDMREYRFTGEDEAAVQKLVTDKYAKWEWNFGRSPAYSYEKEKTFPFGSVKLCLDVKEGIIREAAIFGDFFGLQDKAGLERILRGVRHEKKEVAAALANIDLQGYIAGISKEEFLDLF